MKVLTTEQIRQAEQGCVPMGISIDMLMENAGRAVATEVRRMHPDIKKQRILVLIGPGNNGGDGLVAARYLHDWGAKVTVYLCSQRPPDDANLKLVQERNMTGIEAATDANLAQLDKLLTSTNDVIDALFGTGVSRPLSGIFGQVLDRVKKAKEKRPSLHIIALDLPSGLNSDTGAVDDACLHADDTITLGFPKVGLFRFPGAERVGKLTIADIGIPPHLVATVTTELITPEWAKSVLPRRPLQANKGTFGRVLVIAGSINYIGAAYLACSGAMRVGAGLVTLAMPVSLQPILASKLTEVTYLPLPESQPGLIAASATKVVLEQLAQYQVLLMGCGLGQSQPTAAFVPSILCSPKQPLPALVLDADALNILASIPQWWQQIPGDAIITPHPGEMARLTGLSVAEIQADRIGIANKLAAEWQKTVVLKGAYTVIAAPDGQVKINPVANPGLASAGTGDVLAGAIAGLVAQGLPLFAAAALGVYLHGQAGELVTANLGDAGMTASDLLPALPLVIKQLKESSLE